MRNTKGITLIALIITIIILLILAGIAISALTGSGLFEKTKLAKNKTQNSQKLENQILLEYENKIDNLGDSSKDENWIKIMKLLGVDYSKYNTKTEAFSDATVLTAIKNNKEALKLLPKDKEAFDIACKNDTSIDDEVIKNGIVPQMTSNTSAIPFVVSATTEYNGNGAWRAFDYVTVIRNHWHADRTKPQEFKIDMGTKKEISSFSFTTTDRISSMPKDFTIEGSDDGSNWTVIKDYKDFSNYIVYETTLFLLDETVNYRYYRFNISKDNGYGYVAIAEIQFYN